MSLYREEEIRPKNVFKKLLECCRINALLFSKIGQFEEVNCPGCGSNLMKEAFIKHYFKFVNYELCNSLYNSPRPKQDSFNELKTQGCSSKKSILFNCSHIWVLA